MNALTVIFPFKHKGQWVFSDPTKELDKEPFVAGADTIIDMLTIGIRDARDGFCLFFSDKSFPQYQASFKWVSEEHNGDWYREVKSGMFGWLCPALLKYFETAPKEIYVRAMPIEKVPEK